LVALVVFLALAFLAAIAVSLVGPLIGTSSVPAASSGTPSATASNQPLSGSQTGVVAGANPDLIAVLGTIGQLAAALIAAVALYYGARQLRQVQRVAHSQFLLSVDAMFDGCRDVQSKLRPAGVWAENSGAGPSTSEEWLEVEIYMGLFTRLKLLLDQGLIDLKTIDNVYGHRLLNLVHCRKIYEEKLVTRGGGWADLVDLWHLIDTRRTGKHSHGRAFCPTCAGSKPRPKKPPRKNRTVADSMTSPPEWLNHH
jgi:hypothetical protein